ncbi:MULTISPECIES: hypothetical protein [unclassified Streptomyces]|uniref:hypothetical protein n=1 Tax=unclassified Streptomyces TaxID=2593676 RepID=UPI0033BC9B4E
MSASNLPCNGDNEHGVWVLARLCAEADARELTVPARFIRKYGADRTRLEGICRRYGFARPSPRAG